MSHFKKSWLVDTDPCKAEKLNYFAHNLMIFQKQNQLQKRGQPVTLQTTRISSTCLFTRGFIESSSWIQNPCLLIALMTFPCPDALMPVDSKDERDTLIRA